MSSIGQSTKIQTGSRLVMETGVSQGILKNLQIGDQVNGRVLRALGGSRVLIDLQGTELVASSTLALETGQRLRGIVQTMGPPVTLKILTHVHPQRPRAFCRFRSLVFQFICGTKDERVIPLLEYLGFSESHWMEPLCRCLAVCGLHGDNAPDPEGVKALMMHGGMFFERSLRKWVEGGAVRGAMEWETDLKGIALGLLSQKGGEESVPSAESAMRFLEAFIGKTELFQTANCIAQEEGMGCFFQIPLPFGIDLRTADLFVGPFQKRGKRGGGLQVLLLLDLGEMGRLQIDSNIRDRVVSCVIGVDREETAHLIRSMLGELREGLESQGLTVEKIECFPCREPFAQENLTRHLLTLDEPGAVNIRV